MFSADTAVDADVLSLKKLFGRVIICNGGKREQCSELHTFNDATAVETTVSFESCTQLCAADINSVAIVLAAPSCHGVQRTAIPSCNMEHLISPNAVIG